MSVTITESQRDIMRHSLGADGQRPGYRNHYAAEPNSDAWTEILLLCDAGLMRRGMNIPGGLTYFHVTDAGQDLVGIKYDDG